MAVAGAAIKGLVTVTPVSASAYTVTVVVLGEGEVVMGVGGVAAVQACALPISASTSTDNSVLYDATAPTVTINQGATQADPTNTSPVTFDVVFSEGVSGVAAAGGASSGTATTGWATVTPVSASAYTVTVVVSGDGTVVAAVNVGAEVGGAWCRGRGSTSAVAAWF